MTLAILYTCTRMYTGVFDIFPLRSLRKSVHHLLQEKSHCVQLYKCTWCTNGKSARFARISRVQGCTTGRNRVYFTTCEMELQHG
jgi:hypothetical protein